MRTFIACFVFSVLRNEKLNASFSIKRLLMRMGVGLNFDVFGGKITFNVEKKNPQKSSSHDFKCWIYSNIKQKSHSNIIKRFSKKFSFLNEKTFSPPKVSVTFSFSWLFSFFWNSLKSYVGFGKFFLAEPTAKCLKTTAFFPTNRSITTFAIFVLFHALILSSMCLIFHNSSTKLNSNQIKISRVPSNLLVKMPSQAISICNRQHWQSCTGQKSRRLNFCTIFVCQIIALEILFTIWQCRPVQYKNSEHLGQLIIRL